METRPVRTIVEPAREIPVLLEADVVVTGGGTTGPFAAMAAARQGARVVLIERFGSLGGLLTLGLNTKPSGILAGGIPREVWDAARGIGAAGNDFRATLHGADSVGIASPVDAELMKILLARMCAEAGVQILFECLASAPVVENGVVQGVIIEGKGGRQFVGAKVVIDCSADGDIAAQAGAPFVLGSEEQVMQPVTMYFKMRDVDLERLAAWARQHPEIVPDVFLSDTNLAYGMWLTGFQPLVREFQQKTGIKVQRENITLKTANGEMYVNATRVTGVSGLSPLEISASILECYRQIEAYAQFLREYVPGFEKASVNAIPPVLGVRETRHILGEHVLSGDEVLNGCRFPDSIAVDASANDVHDPKGAEVRFQSGYPYEIPYRCLVPRGAEQILVAGRCISADHKAHGRTRNMPPCMATGQAAGIAAAVAIKDGTTVRNVDVAKVQQILVGMGMPIHVEQLVELV